MQARKHIWYLTLEQAEEMASMLQRWFPSHFPFLNSSSPLLPSPIPFPIVLYFATLYNSFCRLQKTKKKQNTELYVTKFQVIHEPKSHLMVLLLVGCPQVHFVYIKLDFNRVLFVLFIPVKILVHWASWWSSLTIHISVLTEKVIKAERKAEQFCSNTTFFAWCLNSPVTRQVAIQ